MREGESDSDALRRCLMDRLGVTVRIGHQVLLVSHAYEAYTLDLVVYRCGVDRAPSPVRVHALAWVHPEDFGNYPFPKADQQTVDQLLNDA